MRIAILSRNKNLYSTKRLVETAEKAGHEAHVLDYLLTADTSQESNTTKNFVRYKIFFSCF